MEYAAYPYARDTMHEIPISDLQITVADDIFFRFPAHEDKSEIYFMGNNEKETNKRSRKPVGEKY